MPKVTLSVIFDPDNGTIQVNGPTDKILAIGLVGVAQSWAASKFKWDEGEEPPKILPFKGPLPPVPGKGN